MSAIATASGIPVHCSFDEIANVASLVPNPRNPNTHPEKQIQLLAKIIKNQGWRAPITVSKRSGFIVRGHGRLLAAQFLGVDQVPVDRQDYATEAEEWADLIAELAEMGNYIEGLVQQPSMIILSCVLPIWEQQSVVHLVVGVCLKDGLSAPRLHDLPLPAVRKRFYEIHFHPSDGAAPAA